MHHPTRTEPASSAQLPFTVPRAVTPTPTPAVGVPGAPSPDQDRAGVWAGGQEAQVGSEAETGVWPQQQLQAQEQEGKRDELAAEQVEREGEQQEREEPGVEKVAGGGGEAGQGGARQAFCSALGRRGAKGTLSVVMEGSVGTEVERSAPSFSSQLVRPLDILPPEVLEAAVEAANAEANAAIDAAAEAKGAGADAEAAVAAAAALRAEEAAAAAKAAGSAAQAQASRAAPSTRARRKKALAVSEVGGVGGGQAQPHTWTRPATVVSPFAAPAEIPEDSAAPGVEGDARGGAAQQQQQQQPPWLGSPLARSATSASPSCHGAGGAKEQLEHISEW